MADILKIMENKTLHMTEERYPVVAKVAEIAEQERRSMAVMGDILLIEAITHRATQTLDGLTDTGPRTAH